MLPVLFSVGSFPITSFGFFLTLAFLAALYFIWRAAQVYEIDPEKLLDVFFLAIFCAFLISRVYFLVFNPQMLTDPAKIFLFNRYPGFSFWGGLLGGSLGLWFFAKRLKLNLWQVFDFAAVGLLIGVSIASLGCLLGSCQYGVTSHSFLAVNQIGVIGKRFPIQAFEAVLFGLGFLYLWKKLLRFHFAGSVTALGLILLGIIKFGAEFFRHNFEPLPFLQFSLGFIWGAVCFSLGLRIFYQQSRRSFKTDLAFCVSLFINVQRRKLVVSNFRKSCYNLLVNLKFSLKGRRKTFFKSLNVKSNPTKF